jgi:hypothetical protein
MCKEVELIHCQEEKQAEKIGMQMTQKWKFSNKNVSNECDKFFFNLQKKLDTIFFPGEKKSYFFPLELGFQFRTLLAMQACYHLSHTFRCSVHFALVILGVGSHELFAQAGLKLQSF